MKKLLKYLAITSAVLGVLAAVILVKVIPEAPRMLWDYAKFSVKPPVPPVPPEQDLTRIEFYRFVPGARLEDRITVMPPALLKHYSDWDKAPEYESYEPTPADKALLLQYLDLLPEVYRHVFRERCLGVYFMKNLKGNGITTWAEDGSRKVYFHITLNPASLTADLSATLTERENSCFIPDGKSAVTVDAGKKYKGLLYALFHEATHALDYVKGVTPWADNTMPYSLRPQKDQSGNFFSLHWKDFFQPAEGADFRLRDKITFYGLGGGPKISFAEAPLLYAGFKTGFFASLYGSRSWAEDCAELVTMHRITQRLGQPYILTLAGPGGRTVIEPMKSEKVFGRAAVVMAGLEDLSIAQKIAASQAGIGDRQRKAAAGQ